MTTNDHTMTLALDAFCKRLMEGHPSLPTGQSWDATDLDTQNKIKTNFLGPLHAAATVLTKPRQVTSVDELDALPVGSVVLDSRGNAFQRVYLDEPVDLNWYSVGVRWGVTAAEVSFPAMVLHEGGSDV
jgi:hypothetical protein